MEQIESWLETLGNLTLTRVVFELRFLAPLL